MKPFFCSICLLVLLTNCGKKTKLEGHYIRVDEIQIKSLSDAAGGFGLISDITFHETNCEFSYFGIPMSGSYTIDDNKVFINTGGQLGGLSMSIIDDKSLQGTGFIKGYFINDSSDDYKDHIEKTKNRYVTKSKIKIRTRPDTESEVCGSIEKDWEVYVDDKNGAWVLIHSKDLNIKGWCKEKYLEKY